MKSDDNDINQSFDEDDQFTALCHLPATSHQAARSVIEQLSLSSHSMTVSITFYCLTVGKHNSLSCHCITVSHVTM